MASTWREGIFGRAEWTGQNVRSQIKQEKTEIGSLTNSSLQSQTGKEKKNKVDESRTNKGSRQHLKLLCRLRVQGKVALFSLNVSICVFCWWDNLAITAIPCSCVMDVPATVWVKTSVISAPSGWGQGDTMEIDFLVAFGDQEEEN